MLPANENTVGGKSWGWGGVDFIAHKLLFLIKNYFRLHLAGFTKPGGATELQGLAGAWGCQQAGPPPLPQHGAGRR